MHFLKDKTLPFILLIGGLTLLWGCNNPEPQEPDPVRRKSPIAIAKVNHEATDTYIKIVYGQPYKHNRDIFGNLVPYDEVWRTGANEATELTTTQPILFGGQRLEAGTYALFTIPHKEGDWTVILNDELGQWGAFNYKKPNDVLRVSAPVQQQKATVEALTIEFSEVEENSTDIIISWDQTLVKIPVTFIGGSSEVSS